MYNVVGALVWTVLFLGAGFFFGNLPGKCLPATSCCQFATFTRAYTHQLYISCIVHQTTP